MSESLHPVIARARVREVVGVFESPRDLETAFESLELGGFDRADLDALSNLVEVPRSIGALDVTTEKQTKIPRTTEQPVIMSEDVVAAKAVIAGTLGTICALAAVS